MVDQFKDPLAFLRELIQNALDAGSTSIEVKVSSDAKHLVTLEVQDTGDGMDREIIETKLTRLFASSKDGDATKIGKFGVGFSSTFSIRPEAVVVDTARGNERWRVVFAPDGTWKLYTLDEPIEGTRVRVLKRVNGMDAAHKLIGDARATVSKWCRYADARIDFNGSPIAEPFGVFSPVSVRVPGSAPGDEVVVGISVTPSAPWGFYNKGLTLLEAVGGATGAPAWVTFRVRDGALEHTITRDNVIRDDAYERVMRAVNEAAHGPLVDAALAFLESGVAANGVAASEGDLALVRAGLSYAMASGLLDKPARAKRKIFRDARGAGRSLAEIRDAVKANTLARVDSGTSSTSGTSGTSTTSALADALEKAGCVVIRAPAGSPEGTLLEIAGGPKETADAKYVAVIAAAEREQWDAAPLIASLKTIAAASPELAGIGEVIVGRVDDHKGDLSEVPALVVTNAAHPIERSSATAPMTTFDLRGGKAKEAGKKGKGKRNVKRNVPGKGNGKDGDAALTLVLNLACPAVASALRLASRDVWLASFLALRLALPPVAVADGEMGLAAWRARSPS